MRSSRPAPRQRRRLAGVARQLFCRALVVLALVAWTIAPASAGEGFEGARGRDPGVSRLVAPRAALDLPGEPARSVLTGGRGAVSPSSVAGPKVSALPSGASPDVSALPVRPVRPADLPARDPGSPRRGPDPCRGPPPGL